MRLAITVVSLVLLCTSLALGHTVRVDASGGGDYISIQEGVAFASPGDTVLVAAGEYSAFDYGEPHGGQIYIDKSLTLMSEEGAEATVIVGHASSPQTILVGEEPGGKVVVIDGFRIVSSPELAMLLFEGYPGSAVRRCILEGNAYGIRVPNGWYEISDCTIRNTAGFGIEVGAPAGTGCSVFRNTLVDNGRGIDTAYGVTHVGASVFENTVIGGSTGIVCGEGSGVHHNLVRDCGTGLGIFGSAGYVSCNTVVHCGVGVSTGDGCTHIGFGGNIIALNGTGVYRACFLGDYNCNDVWGNNTDYQVVIPAGDDNFPDCDPMFCAPGANNYYLDEFSPCASGETCGLIGALPVGCGASPVLESSWGGVKALFR